MWEVGVVGEGLMEEVRSDLDLKKRGSTRSNGKEVGREPQAVGWSRPAMVTGWVGTMMEGRHLGVTWEV